MLHVFMENAKNRMIPNRQFVETHADSLVVELSTHTLPVYQV